MVLVVAKSCLSCQGLFSFPCSTDWSQGGGYSQDSWPKLARGIFHTVWHHAQYMNWRSWLRGGWPGSLLRDGLVTRWWAIALCITHFVYCILLIIIIFHWCPIKLSLNPQVLLWWVFFPYSPPHPTASRWASSCVVLSCQMGLNHNTLLFTTYLWAYLLFIVT